jgi:hypothetical protein
VYKWAPIHSEEFGIYIIKENKQFKIINNHRENQLEKKRFSNSSKTMAK